SPSAAVIGGPGTWPLKVHAATRRPEASVTVPVRAVSVYRRIVPPGAGAAGPRSAVTGRTGAAACATPPPGSTSPPGSTASHTPSRPVARIATTPPRVTADEPAAPTTRRVTSAATPTSAAAIRPMLQVAGYPNSSVTTGPTVAA